MTDHDPTPAPTSTRAAPRGLAKIMLGPFVLFLLGAAGLVAALVGDGLWDLAGSAALAVLVVLPVIFASRS